jgi:hypothetical protein
MIAAAPPRARPSLSRQVVQHARALLTDMTSAPFAGEVQQNIMLWMRDLGVRLARMPDLYRQAHLDLARRDGGSYCRPDQGALHPRKA